LNQNQHEHIILKGVATNNLQRIDVSIPLNELTVVTGVSGSGKSSLVFDSIYGESFRRYTESLSSFARQYLKALPRPDIESVENLPPAIAVKQNKGGTGNSRSTVGTLTELNDLLRIIFAQRAQIVCSKCGKIVERDTPDKITRKTIDQFTGQQVMLAASLKAWRTLKVKDLKFQLESQGFGRLWFEGKVQRLGEVAEKFLPDCEVIVDRTTAQEKDFTRITEAAKLCLKLGGGAMSVLSAAGQREEFCADLRCCGVDYREPSQTLFSYQHPLGACAVCQGFGSEGQVDWEKVFPKKESSLADEGVALWNFGSKESVYSWAKTSAKKNQIGWTKKFSEYSEREWKWIKSGLGNDDFDGVEGFFRWLDGHKHKPHYRIHSARFRKYVRCSSCNGGRLNELSEACRVDGQSFSQVCRKSVSDVQLWIGKLFEQVSASKTQQERQGIEALEEAVSRLKYLNDVGVHYLSLDRQARTLSGGELQRIHMARCLGSALTDTLYCLDEPTCGLHARDSERLLSVMKELRDQGNSVVVVEHDRTIIRGADLVLEIGPKAGHLGGKIVFQGDASGASAERIDWPKPIKSSEYKSWIEIKGAKTHNLKDISVRIPVGSLTVVCGVSGSGKTSLIQHTLIPILARHLGASLDEASTSLGDDGQATMKIKGQTVGQVVVVTQSGIGRSSRSNIATYLGIYDDIRKLFADQDAAKIHKLTPSSFSFNSPGGRCENCRGLGLVTEDLSFLGEMDVICPVCEGQRFEANVLSVLYRGKSLMDVLNLTLLQALEHFADRNAIVRGLRSAVDLGLGYITLGQATSSFSGGEAQRLKLVRLMQEKDELSSAVLIFDEPSTGLSDTDVRTLLDQLYYLRSAGHTVIVVEHHLGLIQSADWVIEMGPEGGPNGGNVIHEGTVKELLINKKSVTAKFLGD